MTQLSHTPTNEPVEKAGCVIYGVNNNGRRSVIATYSQGRYDAEKTKYYGMAKGSIEKGETPLQAAIRETKEESGIDLERILGKKGIAKLASGHDVTTADCNPTHPYTGVALVRAHGQPLDRNYFSNGIRPLRSNLWGIEISGIEALTSALKNQENVGFGRVNRSVAKMLKRDTRYPPLADMLEWLRTGDMPRDRDWNRDIRRPPKLFTLKGDEKSVFERLESRFTKGKGHIDVSDSDKQWRQFWKFCKKIRKEDKDKVAAAEVEMLKAQFTAMKQQLLDLGILHDSGTIKLDEKKVPLTYYQEGADIVPMAPLILDILHKAKDNHAYAETMAGEGEVAKGMDRRARLALSQLGQLVQFAELKDLQDAAMKTNPADEIKGAKQGKNVEDYLRGKVLDLIDIYQGQSYSSPD